MCAAAAGMYIQVPIDDISGGWWDVVDEKVATLEFGGKLGVLVDYANMNPDIILIPKG